MLTTFIALIILLALRELVYRIFFIYPEYNGSTQFLSRIESSDTFFSCIRSVQNRRIDCVFLGNSLFFDAIDSAMIEKKSKVASTVFGLYGASTLLILKLYRLIATNRPRLLFLQLSPRYIAYEGAGAVTYWENQYREKFQNETTTQFRRWLSCIRSLDLPTEFRPISLRAIEKIVKAVRSGRMNIGRYTPFRFFSAYSWAFDSFHNKRIVEHCRDPVGRFEQDLESFYENEACLLINGLVEKREEVRSSFVAIRQLLDEFIEEGVKVVLVRLPSSERVCRCDDLFFASYAEELSALSEDPVSFMDLSRLGSNLKFHTDGLHLQHSSSARVTIPIIERCIDGLV